MNLQDSHQNQPPMDMRQQPNDDNQKPYQNQVKPYAHPMKYNSQVQSNTEVVSNMPANVEADKRPLSNVAQQPKSVTPQPNLSQNQTPEIKQSEQQSQSYVSLLI